MIIFKKLRERVQLLEYENQILQDRITALENAVYDGNKRRVMPKMFPRLIREDGWDLSYSTLKKKYR